MPCCFLRMILVKYVWKSAKKPPGSCESGGKRQTFENDLPEVCGLVIQALVALGGEIPAEIAFHVVLDEVVPVLFVVCS